MHEDELRILIALSAGLASLGLAVVLAWNAANRARVGRVRLRVRPRWRWRVALVTLALAAGIAAAAAAPPAREFGSLLAAAASIALLAFAPGFLDSVYGDDGVQRGWEARRYGELDAWRLIGEHLRWRLRGDWVATEVPPEEHAALRERLTRERPERESNYGNAGLDPARMAATKSND